MKVCEPVDKAISQLPPQAVYEQYGRASKLLIHPKDVPEIPLQLFDGQQQGETHEDIADNGWSTFATNRKVERKH